MMGTFHTFAKTRRIHGRMMLAVAILAASIPAMAAEPKNSARADRPKPCPKGQVALTSKITGAHFCAVLGGVTVIGGGPQPVLIPEKPKAKPKVKK
jgi:hypothetical protein